MKIFEGKSPAERNKLIAAIVLGVLAVGALTWGIILPMFASKKRTTSTQTPTPTVNVATNPSPNNNAPPPPVEPVPNQSEIDSVYQSTPVVYNIGSFSAPPPGRNIFAFYEPPKPTPFSPTPTPPPPTPPTPTPPTPPKYTIYSVSPGSRYAGQDGFLMRISGADFDENVRILFNGTPLATNFISPQGLTAQVSENLIASSGSKQISVVSDEGFSNIFNFNVQIPPKPEIQYIGMISRKRNNNDTAYFQKKGRNEKPFSARLNDVVERRFRIKSISVKEVVFEDTQLGFQHKLALYRPKPGERSTFRGGGNDRRRGNFVPYRPNNRRRVNTNNPRRTTTRTPTRTNTTRPQKIPGIPDNIPRYKPTPRPTKRDPGDKKDNDNR